MPIRVYIWNYISLRESVGHGSMSLSDNFYISWWPAFQKSPTVWSGPGVAQKSLEVDIMNEDNRNPDHRLRIPDDKSLDETKMKTWFNGYKNGGTYSLLKYNCCWAVEKALIEGGIAQYITVPSQLVNTPGKLKALMVKLGAIDEVTNRPLKLTDDCVRLISEKTGVEGVEAILNSVLEEKLKEEHVQLLRFTS